MSDRGKHGFLRKVGHGLLLLLCVCIVFVTVILLNPEETLPAPEQPLMSAHEAIIIQGEEELPYLLKDFPAPALAANGRTALKFQGGSSYDSAFESGFARILSLNYTYQDKEVTVLSIYPARAISLLPKEGYHLSAATSPLLSGGQTVRMEDGKHVRIHLQTDYGVYAVVIPRNAVGLLTEIVRPLQLMTAGAE